MSVVEFQTVWKVIKALGAHDDVLGEQLDQAGAVGARKSS